MPSPAFDTHAEIRKLQEAGCAEEQAEAMVDLVSRTPTDSRVLTRLDGVDSRLDGIDTRLDGIDTRLDGIDTRLDGIDTRLDGIDTRLDGIDTRLDRFESSVDVRFERLEGHVDVCFERLDGRMENLQGRFDNLEDRVKGMVTETMFVKEFAKLYKHLLIGGVGICAVIVTAFAAALSTFITLSLS